MSSFMNLEIGKKSIISHQTAISVSGHNLANVNTEGYSRQRATITQSRPWHMPVLTASSKVGQLGTGVFIESVNRIRDVFLDIQVRTELKTAGMWYEIDTGLKRMEAIANEPTESGLRGVLDEFWKAWEDLTLDSEYHSTRTVLLQRAIALVDDFQHIHKRLTDMRQDCNEQIKIKVEEANVIAREIAALNKSIMLVTVSGRIPNDLMDQRDLWIDKLSQLGDVTVHTDKNNMLMIQFGNRVIVENIRSYEMTTVQDDEGMSLMIWEDSGLPVIIKSGEIYVLMELRGSTNHYLDPYGDMVDRYGNNAGGKLTAYIPWMLAKLNDLAMSVVESVNELHRQGYSLFNQSDIPDGSDFFILDIPFDINDPDLYDPSTQTFYDFKYNWARYLTINPDLIADNTKIAAAVNPTWKDGEHYNFADNVIGIKISQLKHTAILGKTYYKVGETLPDGSVATVDLIWRVEYFKAGETLPDGTVADLDTLWPRGNRTADDYWRSAMADLGVWSQESYRMVLNQTAILIELDDNRLSISGVSIDEEWVDIIKFQHAYNAASRYITTIDEELDVIVNRMGLVGR